mgnify:CR=1 FL=1|jgi:hypothetical protein
MWNCAQRFTVTTTTKPSRTVFRLDGKLVMHPALAAELRAAIKTSAPEDLPQLTPFSMGTRVAPKPEWYPSAGMQRGFVDVSSLGIPIRPNNSIINLKGF